MTDLESDRVERKSSTTDGEKIRQAICAYANDLPEHRQPGYVFVGVNDVGTPTGLPITDRLLLNLADMRSDGNILPIPSLTVQKVVLRGAAVAVVEVQPSDAPPVRFKGQVWIRVGPRRAIATLEEERRLTERQVSWARTFDLRACPGATSEDVLLDAFRSDYLPRVVARDVIDQNRRTVDAQMASLRFYDVRRGAPTNAGILVFGRDPRQFLPGAYVQFVRFDGTVLSDPVQDQKEISGNLLTQLQQLDNLLPLQIRSPRGPHAGMQHEEQPDYPRAAVREIALNAVMHRNYDGTNAPIHIYWFADRIEIQNPGGLYGQVNSSNYESACDYRNPVLAEAMKVLGYVEKFGTGIARAKAALRANGNPPPDFNFQPSHVSVLLRSRV